VKASWSAFILADEDSVRRWVSIPSIARHSQEVRPSVFECGRETLTKKPSTLREDPDCWTSSGTEN